MGVFELRNQIVHNRKEVNMSNTKLSSLCDNTLSFLEAAIFVAQPRFMKDVIPILGSRAPLR